MFERDHYGQNPELQYPYFPGGVAPSRHSLTKQRYTEARQSRLDAEANERRHQASVEREKTVAKAIGKMTKFALAFINRIAVLRSEQAK